MPEHRDGRVTETRQLILKEAEKLYHAGGYENINLQVIANQLNITKAALFHHFKNKQALFFEMLMALLEHMRQMFEAAIEADDPSVRARLGRLMVKLTLEPYFDVMRFQREEMKLLQPEQQQTIRHAWNSGPFAVVERVFREGMRRGDLKEHDATLAAYLFLNICILLPRVDNPIQSIMNYQSHDQYISSVLNILLDGLARKEA